MSDTAFTRSATSDAPIQNASQAPTESVSSTIPNKWLSDVPAMDRSSNFNSGPAFADSIDRNPPAAQAESVPSTPRMVTTPETLRTPKSPRSNMSSQYSSTDIKYQLLPRMTNAQRRLHKLPEPSKYQSTSRASSRSLPRHSNTLKSSTLQNASDFNEPLSPSLGRGRKRSTSALPSNKRPRSSRWSADNTAALFSTEYRKLHAPPVARSRRRSSRIREGSNFARWPELNMEKALSLNFSVQGRDIWGKPGTEDYTLELDADEVKGCLNFYAQHFENIHPENLPQSKLKGNHPGLIRQGSSKDNYADPPETYLRPAFVALCCLAARLTQQNDELIRKEEMLQEKIESLEIGPKTPASLLDDEDNDGIGRLLGTIRTLQTENALLRLSQLESSSSPISLSAQDDYQPLLPLPTRQDSNRMSLALDRFRKEEQTRYEESLDRARKGILKRQRRLDSLTTTYNQELSRFQQQFESQQEENEGLRRHIHRLEDERQRFAENRPIDAHKCEYLRHKYDALEAEYVKVKNDRDVVTDDCRLAQVRLGGLLVKQAQSQVAMQQTFELARVSKWRRSSSAREESRVASPASEETTPSFGQQGDSQSSARPEEEILAAEHPFSFDSSIAPLSVVKKTRPAPLKLGNNIQHSREVNRSNQTQSSRLRATEMLDPTEVVDSIPPGSPGVDAWRNALESPGSFGPPGFTPIFASEAFKQWTFSICQRAQVLFDITSMNNERRLYTFRQNDIVYVYPGAGDFWPVQIAKDDSAQVFPVPKSAIALVCDHDYPYDYLYNIESTWKAPDSSELVSLRSKGAYVHCAHIERSSLYGCLMLRNGERGYAPMNHLSARPIRPRKTPISECPCNEGELYYQDAVILKECLSEAEGVRFHQGDIVEVAHHTPTGAYCVRLNKGGATGFVPAACLRILEDPGNDIWDRRLARRRSEIPNLDEKFESTLPSPQSFPALWNDNVMGNNPEYRRWSQLDRDMKDKKYAEWVKGPPLGDHFIEVEDLKKLPPLFKAILTINPLDPRSRLTRARAKSFIPREKTRKYHLKRGLHIGLQSNVTVADGEIAFTLDDGTEEDRGYMSEPVTEEKRSRRAHFVFEQGKPPLNLDKYQLEEDEQMVKRLKWFGFLESGTQNALNQNHRRPGFLTEEGLWALRAWLERKRVRDNDTEAIHALYKWLAYGYEIAFSLQSKNSIKGKVGYKNSDLVQLIRALPVPAPKRSRLLVGHIDRRGRVKKSNAIIIAADEIAYEDPKILTCVVFDINDDRRYAKAILAKRLFHEDGEHYFQAVIMGDGTPDYLNRLALITPAQMSEMLEYVSLKDVLHIIRDAEKKASDPRRLEDTLPEVNDTVRELYDSALEDYESDGASTSGLDNPVSPLTEYVNKILQDDSEEDITEILERSQNDKAKVETRLCNVEKERSGLQQDNAILQEKNAALIHQIQSLEKKLEDLRSEKQERLTNRRDQEPQTNETPESKPSAEFQRENHKVVKETPEEVQQVRSHLMGDLVNSFFRQHHQLHPEKIFELAKLIESFGNLMKEPQT